VSATGPWPDGRERLAIARDGTGTVLVLMSARGNGTGMDLFQWGWDGTGYDFHSRVPLCIQLVH